MSKQTFASKIRRNLTQWHPALTRELRESGQLEATVQARAKRAQERLLELMEQGYREHEAEEVVNSEIVNLRPEAGADLEPWEREELAKLEAEYRATR